MSHQPAPKEKPPNPAAGRAGAEACPRSRAKGQRSRPRSGCTAASLPLGAAAHPLSREHHLIPLPGTPGSSAASRVPGLPVLPLVPADLPPRCTPSPGAPRPRGAGRCPRRAARRRSSGAARYLASRPAETESRSCRQDEPHAGEAADHGAVRCAAPSRAAPSGASSCRAEPCPAVPQRAPLTATPRARPPRLSPPPPAAPGPCPPPGGHLRRGARRGAEGVGRPRGGPGCRGAEVPDPTSPPCAGSERGARGCVRCGLGNRRGWRQPTAPNSLLERAPAGRISPAVWGGRWRGWCPGTSVPGRCSGLLPDPGVQSGG